MKSATNDVSGNFVCLTGIYGSLGTYLELVKEGNADIDWITYKVAKVQNTRLINAQSSELTIKWKGVSTVPPKDFIQDVCMVIVSSHKCWKCHLDVSAKWEHIKKMCPEALCKSLLITFHLKGIKMAIAFIQTQVHVRPILESFENYNVECMSICDV